MRVTTIPSSALPSAAHAAALPLAADGQITLLEPERDAPGVIHMLRPRESLPRVGARSLSVSRASAATARAFYTAYHPQGAPGNEGEHIGLWSSGGALLACMTFSFTADRRGVAAQRRDGGASLVRFATCANIPGGASRLLAHWREANPSAAITSYSDPRLFTGGMYAALGFRHTRTLKPDYRVFDPTAGVLRHKSAFQRSRLEAWRVKAGAESVPPFDAAADPRTEREMLEAIGFPQVWLPGLLRWDLPAKGHEKYWRWYDALCARGQARSGEKPLGWERHHIRPRAWGGTDDTSNIARLSPREHYIAHLLLARIAPGDRAMLQAAWMMATRAGAGASARRYEALRVAHAALKREEMRANCNDPVFTAKRKTAQKAVVSLPGFGAKVATAMASREVKQKLLAHSATKRKAMESNNANPEWVARVKAGRPLVVAASTRAKQSEALRVRWAALAPDERVQLMRERIKNPGGERRVTCMTTGETFRSITAAAAWLRLNGHPKASGAVIGQAANPRSSQRLTAYGHRWEMEGTAPAERADGRRKQPGVVRVSTGETFASAYQAAQVHGGVSHANISRACRCGGTAGGERWVFA